MKKSIINGALFITIMLLSTQLGAQVVKTTTKTQPIYMTKKYASGTIGSALQQNPAIFQKLNPSQQQELMRYNNSNVASSITQTPIWISCMFFPSTCDPKVTKDNFGSYHPCGIAVSKKNKVAVSTYEGDGQNGKVFVWSSFTDFNAGKPSTYQYDYLQPEALVFGDDETLYIACTSEGKIYHRTDYKPSDRMVFLNQKPYADESLTVDNNIANPANWNPRQMVVQNGGLYVMCENLYKQNHPSKVVRIELTTTGFKNPAVITEVKNTGQAHPNALGVSLLRNEKMVTSDIGETNNSFVNSTVSVYTITNSTQVSNFKYTNGTSATLSDVGGALDVAIDDNYVYFTNTGGYLVRWDYKNGNNGDTNTKNIKLNQDGIYTPWGVFLTNNLLLVADAPEHKVVVYNLATTNWN